MKLELITLIVRVAVAVMCGIVVPVVKKWLEAKTENEKLNQIKETARTAVAAAEQIYNAAEKSDPDGELRWKFAANAVKRVAKQTGVALTDREITEIIEAAVQEINIFTHAGMITKGE